MNKKGFTLIELLAVIFVLALLMSVVIPAVSNVISKSKKTANNMQINKILNATYDYSLKNNEILPEYNETKYITLNHLMSKDFLTEEVINPNNKQNFEKNLVISISNVGSNYKYDKENSLYKGYYLYKLEYEFMKTDEFKNNKPTITLDGYGSESFVSSIDLGDEVDEPKYTATTKSGVDITDKVAKNIIYKEKNIDSINTLKAGIYYVNYTVVDDKGYSNILTRSIVIVDNTAPELTVPDNKTISLSTTSFDLLEGTSCTDNSGVCDIKVYGKINFGVKGKYIIEYDSYDPTGNTKTIKRVITIE